MAAGKVVTGFSKPYVATYANVGGTTTYGTPEVLARGVEVSIEAEASDANNFYADNVIAESESGQFTGGTLTLTVDGLFQSAEALIQGLGAADADGWIAYDKNQSAPLMGCGFIVRSVSAGVTKYTPIILPKVRFNPFKVEAKTAEDSIDYQTTELTANIMRDDTAAMAWKWVGSDYASEDTALTALVAKFSASPVTT